jgi:hypothetical protein
MSEQFEKDLKRLEILREELEKIGYFGLRVVEGRGICGIEPFIFTYGLCYGLDYWGRQGRWCYEKKYAQDAVIALAVWDGKEDPAGRWIKYKGDRGEYSNPKLLENEIN